MSALAVDPIPLRSRAVEIQVNAGQTYRCVHCDSDVKFRARNRMKAIICNVYGSRPKRWLRVEVFHPRCYEEAGEPHGAVDRTRGELLHR